jgi:hypothetical protein
MVEPSGSLTKELLTSLCSIALTPFGGLASPPSAESCCCDAAGCPICRAGAGFTKVFFAGVGTVPSGNFTCESEYLLLICFNIALMPPGQFTADASSSSPAAPQCTSSSCAT